MWIRKTISTSNIGIRDVLVKRLKIKKLKEAIANKN